MKIGILTAMSVEHEQICKLLRCPDSVVEGIHTYTLGQIGRHDVVLMQCGIGKVNAAIGTTALIARFRPDAVVSTGCAGGIDEGLDVMDVVASRTTVYHDVWCGEGNAYGQVQGLPERFASDERLLHTATRLADDPTIETTIRTGLICTGDKFISDPATLAQIKADFPDGLAVDMESAAIAHACHVHGVPFLSFRIVSDTPGVDNHWQQYQDFWGEMAHRSFGVTRRFLENL